jgi:hypothetical protein
MSTERRIKFLARDLAFPTDPTFREYKVVEELTGVTASQVMLGTAGIWMLPVLAIVALIRANPAVTIEQLDKILDLGPGDIEVTGLVEDEPVPLDEKNTEDQSTGTPSTDEIPEPSGDPVLPTTSPEQPEVPTT